MSKFDEAVAHYKEAMSGKLGMSAVNDELLTAVAKSLGPSIYLADASLVSCSDKTERDRVKNNFLIKKLGMTDAPELDAAIMEVCHKFGDANRSKHRAVFYYLLVEKFGKQEMFAKK